MRNLTIAQIVISLLQIILCGFSLGIIFSIIARALFVGKLVGMRISMNVTFTLEVIGVVLLFFLPILFRWNISWGEVLISMIIASISCLITWYDDTFFVYVEEEI